MASSSYIATKYCRMVMVPMCGVLTALAVIFTAVAAALPGWLFVEISDIRQAHLHGLWLDCIQEMNYSGPYGTGFTPVNAMQCTYKFDNPAMQFNRGMAGNEWQQHLFQDWQKAVLILLFIAFTCGAAAFFFILCALCLRVSSLVADVLNLIAVCASCSAIVMFFVVSHRMDVRVITSVVNSYEQEKSTAFYLGALGSLFFILAFIVGILSTILLFLHERNEHNQRSLHRQRQASGTTNNSPLLADGRTGASYQRANPMLGSHNNGMVLGDTAVVKRSAGGGGGHTTPISTISGNQTLV